MYHCQWFAILLFLSSVEQISINLIIEIECKYSFDFHLMHEILKLNANGKNEWVDGKSYWDLLWIPKYKIRGMKYFTWLKKLFWFHMVYLFAFSNKVCFEWDLIFHYLLWGLTGPRMTYGQQTPTSPLNSLHDDLLSCGIWWKKRLHFT